MTAASIVQRIWNYSNTRISLRERIFREVIANLIVHREYTNAHAASFTIYKDRVEILNANNPNGSGPISISNFLPFPKNPIISKFFVQIGRVEELGSGIINVNKYLKHYSPDSKPEFIEDSLFKTILPIKGAVSVSDTAVGKDVVIVEIDDALKEAISGALNEALNEGVNDGVNEGVSDGVKEELSKLLEILKEMPGIKASEIAVKIVKSKPTVERYIRILKRYNIIEFKGAPKTGGYFLTEKFKGKLAH